jgi:hypothetical protein
MTARVVPLAAAGLFAAAVGFVAAFGSNCPHSDEWYLMAEVLRPDFSWAWVTAHHNEHRYVLAKSLWYASLRLTDFDFRAGMFATLAFVGAAVALLLAAVRRGGWSVADVLIPAVLLHWGHWFAWLMSYQMAFSAVVFCAAGFAWAVTLECEKRAAGFASAFLALAVLNGGFGVGWGGPMALWVGWVAWRRRSVGLAVVPLLAAAHLAFVLLTTPAPVSRHARPDAAGFLTAAVGYLGLGFGPAGLEGSAGLRAVLAAAAVLLPVAGLLAAGRAILVRPEERVRAAGLVAGLVGHLAVAGSVAWYRGEGLGERFVTPSAVGLAVAWLAVRRHARPPRGVTVLVAVAAGGVVWMNAEDAYWQARFQHTIQEGLLADAGRGTPALFLTGKHGGQWQIADPTGTHYAALRDAGVGPFRRTPPDPAFVAVPVAVAEALPAGDGEPGAVAVPDAPRPVLGLRVRVEQLATVGWQEVALVWSDGGVAHREVAHPATSAGQRHDLVFETTRLPTRVRLGASSPSAGLRILAAEWLVPAQ